MLEGRPPTGHPLALLEAEAADYSLSEEQRCEIIGLGLPDDGYDYLRHLRALGPGPSTQQGAGAGTHVHSLCMAQLVQAC